MNLDGEAKSAQRALELHSAECRQCNEAFASASGSSLPAPDPLRFPCLHGLELINSHVETVRRAEVGIDPWVKRAAMLIRAPEGPVN